MFNHGYSSPCLRYSLAGCFHSFDAISIAQGTSKIVLDFRHPDECNDEQGFIGDAHEDRSGRVRRCAEVEATASDGAENAINHAVTSFLVLGHRKGGVFRNDSA